MAVGIGERLREMRRQRVLSQRDLALLAGVPQSTVARIEEGKQTPRPSTIRKLAKALDIRAVDLLGPVI